MLQVGTAREAVAYAFRKLFVIRSGLNCCARIVTSNTMQSNGSGSDGPAQAALAILAVHLREPDHQIPVLLALGFVPTGPSGDEDIYTLVPRGMELHEYLAIRYHQTFKAKIIAGLPKEGWELTSEHIDRSITESLRPASA